MTADDALCGDTPVDKIIQDLLAEVARADALHGPLPNIIHAAAVLRRETEEAWAEVWEKPVDHSLLREELMHVIATGVRYVRLIDARKHPMMAMQDGRTRQEV